VAAAEATTGVLATARRGSLGAAAARRLATSEGFDTVETIAGFRMEARAIGTLIAELEDTTLERTSTPPIFNIMLVTP
jgi:hypothetical protein